MTSLWLAAALQWSTPALAARPPRRSEVTLNLSCSEVDAKALKRSLPKSIQATVDSAVAPRTAEAIALNTQLQACLDASPPERSACVAAGSLWLAAHAVTDIRSPGERRITWDACGDHEVTVDGWWMYGRVDAKAEAALRETLAALQADLGETPSVLLEAMAGLQEVLAQPVERGAGLSSETGQQHGNAINALGSLQDAVEVSGSPVQVREARNRFADGYADYNLTVHRLFDPLEEFRGRVDRIQGTVVRFMHQRQRVATRAHVATLQHDIAHGTSDRRTRTALHELRVLPLGEGNIDLLSAVPWAEVSDPAFGSALDAWMKGHFDSAYRETVEVLAHGAVYDPVQAGLAQVALLLDPAVRPAAVSEDVALARASQRLQALADAHPADHRVVFLAAHVFGERLGDLDTTRALLTRWASHHPDPEYGAMVAEHWVAMLTTPMGDAPVLNQVAELARRR